jgi:hypothetical protein
MKTIILAILFAASVARAGVITTNIDFNNFTGATLLGSSYSAGGVMITSPASLNAASGYFSSVLFGGGGSPVGSPALFAPSTGLLAITAGGELMTDVRFEYGFDWNFYQIEYGLLDTFFNWQAWSGDQLVGSGTQAGGKSHGGGYEEITSQVGFDRLLISSMAIAYQAIPGPYPILYSRGLQIPIVGDTNRIAIDNLRVTYDPPDAAAPVGTPDGASTLGLLAAACALVGCARLAHP